MYRILEVVALQTEPVRKLGMEVLGELVPSQVVIVDTTNHEILVLLPLIHGATDDGVDVVSPVDDEHNHDPHLASEITIPLPYQTHTVKLR